MSISAQLRYTVRLRSGFCCEYCHLPEQNSSFPFHVDHIRPRKHDGSDDINNLCFSCYDCNGHKGADISGFDPLTDEIVRLFNPRKHNWEEHFDLSEDSVIIGLTAEGSTTARVLKFNIQQRVKQRHALVELGVYPCL